MYTLYFCSLSVSSPYVCLNFQPCSPSNSSGAALRTMSMTPLILSPSPCNHKSFEAMGGVCGRRGGCDMLVVSVWVMSSTSERMVAITAL